MTCRVGEPARVRPQPGADTIGPPLKKLNYPFDRILVLGGGAGGRIDYGVRYSELPVETSN